MQAPHRESTQSIRATPARYVRVWLNGNSSNMFNHWTQIEVCEAR